MKNWGFKLFEGRNQVFFFLIKMTVELNNGLSMKNRDTLRCGTSGILETLRNG
jgi:hypothetical protein